MGMVSMVHSIKEVYQNMKYKTIKHQLSILTAAVMLGSSFPAVTAVTAAAETVSSSSEAALEDTGDTASGNSAADDSKAVSEEDSKIFKDDSDGGHAIETAGTEESYSGITVTKTGEADGDEADFYGENAAVFATDGAQLTIEDASVTTDGTHANGIFSYGNGTVVRISDSVIETSGNCSGGLMVTGGGTLEAENLTIHTSGNSSAAIRSDRGGGTETVTGGSYTTEGTGSPVIYSTADVTVSDAELTSAASQGVVVEGKNSVTLQNVTLTADNNTKNSDKSDTYQAVMIYQSMSGDAAEGEASFTMEDGSLTNKNGDIFFVNNTVAAITLRNAEIVNEDAGGVFLRAEAAGWGSEGSNGGHVTLTAEDQAIEGNMLVDDVSSLNLYLGSGSSFTGAVNPDAESGSVYVELADDTVWTLTADSHISSLTCGEDAIDLNGYTLYVNGEVYETGTASEGEAIEVEVTASEGPGAGRPDAPPSGDGERPDMPEGNHRNPPEKPSGDLKCTRKNGHS